MNNTITKLNNNSKIIVNKRKKYTVKICTVVLGFSSLGHLAESRIQIWVQFERSLIIKILRKQNIFSFFSGVRGVRAVRGVQGVRGFRGSGGSLSGDFFGNSRGGLDCCGGSLNGGCWGSGKG